jgi:predicted SnoaL-like aldol condensation-catalyzing enzyme
VLAVGDPGIDGLRVGGGDVEVHADITRSNAISGTAEARRDAIPCTLSSPHRTPGNAARLVAVAGPTSVRRTNEEAGMADLEANKQTVRAYYERAFNEGDPEGAVERYMGSRYIQHNPQAADGPEAFIGFVKWYRGEFPQLAVEIKRVIAEGDLVVTHGVIRTSPEDRGTAAVDIFRLEDGRIVEHWDVLQPVPETAENDNTMF